MKEMRQSTVKNYENLPEIRKKKEDEYNVKMDFYEQKVKEYNKWYFKDQRKQRNPNFRVRIPHRRASDGLIKVTFPMEDPYFDLAKLIEKKKQFKEDNPYEMPVTKDRFQYRYFNENGSSFPLTF